MIVLCSVAAAGYEVQPKCHWDYLRIYRFISHCSFKPTSYNWFCLCQKSMKFLSLLLDFSFCHSVSSLCSHETKIDPHIIQQLYLSANCHFAWVQNAYYGCTASIWNDCRLQIQWLVTLLVAMGWDCLCLSPLLCTKPTILPRLHSLTPRPWLTTKFCLTQTNPLTSNFQIFLWSAHSNLANNQPSWVRLHLAKWGN